MSVTSAPSSPATAGRGSSQLWLVLSGVSVATLLIPLLYLVVRVSEIDAAGFRKTLFESRALELTLNSLGLATAVSATALALGVAIAVFVTRDSVRWRKTLLALSALPLAVPSYLAAYGWLVVAPGINGLVASWFLLTAVTVPYVTLPTAAALRAVGQGHEMVARTLGRTPSRAFFQATWPQIRPAALAGTLLVFLYTVSDFGLVALMRFHTLTWGVNAAYSASFNRNQAAVLALLVVLLALIAVVGERALRGNTVLYRAKSTVTGLTLPRGIRASMLILALSPIALGVLVPLAGLGIRLLQAQTLREVDGVRLLEATGWTMTVSLLAAVAATLIAFPIAVLVARAPGRLSRTLESLGYLSHALPGIVVGLSLVFLTLRLLPAVYQTIAVLVFGYTVLFASKAMGTSRSSIEAVSPQLTMVARTLGDTPWRAWRRVTLPLALPGISVGALLVFLATMKELPATLILRPTGVDTLATELWSRTVAVEFGAAAPYAAVLVLLATIPAMLLSGIRSERGEER